MANWTRIEADFPPPGDDGTRTLDAPWMIALKAIEDCDHLRIEADGEWKLLPNLDLTCGPDGRSDIPISNDALFVPSCPPGALIGRIGGSSADRTIDNAEAKVGAPIVIAIGKVCMVPLKDLPHGPVFIGINIRPRPITILRINLEIFGATIG